MARGRAAEDADQDGGTVPESEHVFWQLWQQIKRAESESEVLAVAQLMKDMPRAPTAVIAWLERRFGKRWSRAERREVEISGGGQPIEVMLSARDRVRAKFEELAAKRDLVLANQLTDNAGYPASEDHADATSPSRFPNESEHRERRKGPSFA